MAATDLYNSMGAGLDSPAEHAAAVTPSDSAALTYMTRALWVGGAGNLTVIMKDGTTVTFTAITVGWVPLRVSQVKATGTTATNIVAVW